MTVLKSIRDLSGKDVVILFGKSRAGKSTFINDAYREKVAESTGSLTSETQEISYVAQPIRVDDHEVVLVDTVGLGGSGEDHDRASFTWKWLSIFHSGKDRKNTSGPTVKGFLYFIDIMDGAINEDNIRNLETFKALVGEEVLGSVIFVTTKWATKEEQTTRKRLENNFVGWAEKIHLDFPGASILRLDDTTGRLDEEGLNELSPAERTEEEREYHNNAMRVLRQLLQKQATKSILAEKEMNEGGLETGTGNTTSEKAILRHVVTDLKRAAPVGGYFMKYITSAFPFTQRDTRDSGK
ncbi:hypothetical protein DL96DRAFT_1824293 [Flagelloscypha sp. PMI_526]|nr:hypothetical protein DL96DRAFT_1824293 [Flagelloscypha sp. PMI_526]